MSKIISLEEERERQEMNRFLRGKATREFVLQEVGRLDADIEMIGEELKRSATGFSQLFTLQKMLGLQFETLVRMLDENVPEFRANFAIEYKRTVSYSNFIESLNNEGTHAAKPMMEKIDIVREWNKNKNNLKIKGFYFGLPEYILSHPTEFTEDQVELLAIEFEFPEVFEQYKSLLSSKEPVVEETVASGPVTSVDSTSEDKNGQ